MHNAHQEMRQECNKSYITALKSLVSQLERGRVVVTDKMQITMTVAPSNKDRDLTRIVNHLTRITNGDKQYIDFCSSKARKPNKSASVKSDKVSFLINPF